MKIGGKKDRFIDADICSRMLLGAVLGIVIGEPMTKVGFIGTIWLNCIKMIVVPMVLVTIVTVLFYQKMHEGHEKNQLPYYGTIILSPHWLPAIGTSGYIHCRRRHSQFYRTGI